MAADRIRDNPGHRFPAWLIFTATGNYPPSTGAASAKDTPNTASSTPPIAVLICVPGDGRSPTCLAAKWRLMPRTADGTITRIVTTARQAADAKQGSR